MLDFEKLQNDTVNYIAELQQAVHEDPQNLEKIDSLAEAYFETGEAELAYPLLEQAIKLDPEGKQGAQKFFWLGQMLGGHRGIQLFRQGLSANPNNVAQVNEALLGMIEIWMTDLCMEPEAEAQCEDLIKAALANTDQDAEAYSVLGSIRISQQRNSDAQTALLKAWELFQRDFANSSIELAVFPKLLRLAQSMLELGMFDLVLEVTDQLHKMDDQVAEVHYLYALAHKNLFLQSTTALERSKNIVSALDALEMVKSLDEPAEVEIVEAIEAIVNELPAPEIENPFEGEENDEARQLPEFE